MKYPQHTNPTAVYCHDCGEDITLHGQYIYDSEVLCGRCNEVRTEGFEKDPE
jgi:formylmethanofuran dehydrogenase subunit E